MYSEALRGDKSLTKYFASWYDAVLMLEIIGHIGRGSIVPSFFNLCNLAEPYNRAGAGPVGYDLLYSCSENLDFIFLKTFVSFVLWLQ